MTALTLRRFAAPWRALPLPWPALAALGAALAYGDGFWLTALQRAIGAVERQEAPFAHWLRDATLMLPLFVLAVALALAGARRLVEGRLAALALVVVLAGSGVAIAEAAVSSALDYRHQVRHLEFVHGGGSAVGQELEGLAVPAAASSPGYVFYCNLRGADAANPLAQIEYATLMVHVRALAYFAAIVLATNLVLVAGALVFAPPLRRSGVAG